MRSIRTFLLLAISCVVILVFVLAAIASFNRARYETDELFDAELAQTARILRSTLEVAASDDHVGAYPDASIRTQDWKAALTGLVDDEERTRLGHAYERKILFQVTRNGERILYTDNSPLIGDWSPEEGYQMLKANGFKWHLFSLLDGDTWYTVGERGDIRDEVARKIALSSLFPSLFALPVLLLLLVMTLQRGLRPLNELDRHIQTRNKDNLDAIELPASPAEISPIVDSLNELLARLRRSLESERRFSAMASHEMRTPLAVLKVNVQNALKARTDHERVAMLQDIDAGVDRASRLVNQLLTLSRLEQDEPGFETVTLDILPILREEIAALYPIALQRKQSIELLTSATELQLRTVPQLFPLIIRNLVDNAIKYSPEGGRLQIQADHQGDQILLCVEDCGPGIPPQERDRIFERFYRVRGTNSDVGGSGLGLAIVWRVAELLQAKIAVDSSAELGGLSIRVMFPA